MSCNNCPKSGRRALETATVVLSRKDAITRKAQEVASSDLDIVTDDDTSDESRVITLTKQGVHAADGKGFAMGLPALNIHQ